MSKAKDRKECEVPDVAEFLKLSRSLVRQADLIKDMDISKEHRKIIKKASDKVTKELACSLNEEISNDRPV